MWQWLATNHGRLVDEVVSPELDEETSGINPPMRVKFVTTVNEVFSDNFPDLWKLGQAYFTGKLLLKEDGNSSGRVDPVKQEAYKRMILESLRFYCSLIRAALLPHTLNTVSPSEAVHFGIWPEKDLETIGSWIPQCLRCVRSCYSSLIRLNLPGDALDIMQILIFDLRVHSMVTLFHQVIEDVSNIHLREDWFLEIDDENGGITQLPLLFENTIIEKLQLIKESVLHTGLREQEIFVHPHVQNIVKQMTSKLLTAFTSSLEALAFQQHTDSKTNDHNDSVAVGNLNDSIPAWEKHLLIILSNCNYVLLHILPRLSAVYKKNGYPDVTSVIKASTSNYHSLDQKVFEAYIEKKCDPIIGAIEQNIYVGKFDWNECSVPKVLMVDSFSGARSYIKHVIMDIIAVHSEVNNSDVDYEPMESDNETIDSYESDDVDLSEHEDVEESYCALSWSDTARTQGVYSVSPNLVKRVMTRIVELVAEEIARLFTCIPKFSAKGTLQARLDIFALRDVLSIYQTTVSSNHFKECMSCLPLLDEIKDKQ
ncbi:Exocyst complex component 2 [Nymphon striatum]|nr:Exocyst complex component 2 [Nymphon striatum]